VRSYFLLALVLSINIVVAQSVSPQIGSRASGIGYASATLFDTWSLFNNPAAAAHLKQITAGFTYDLRPELTGANRTAAVINLPVKIGVTSLGAYRFGDDLYNEHLVSASFSSKFGLASLGVQINYVQYAATGFGNKGVATINLGGIAELSPKMSIGAYIVNVNQPVLGGEEKLPTRLVAGMAFKPIEKIFLATEIDKDLDSDPLWKVGVEYFFHKKFAARTGYNINPNTGFFGFGFKARKLTIDYAVQYNVLVRMSHQASVAYQFSQ
jgi:hypothetical protein